VKRRKTDEPYLDHVCAHEDKENEVTENESEKKQESIGSGALSTEAKLVVEDEGVECSYCGEVPCVWLTAKKKI
jgi:hypothetical protein